MKRKLLVLTVVASVCFASHSFALGKGHSNGGSTRAPIDGGIGLLLLAGAGLGVKRVLDKRKQKKDTTV